MKKQVNIKTSMYMKFCNVDEHLGIVTNLNKDIVKNLPENIRKTLNDIMNLEYNPK